MSHIVVNQDKASTIYAYAGAYNDDGTPTTVLLGVPNRDLTEFDLAALQPHDRLALEQEAKKQGGGFRLVGKVPAGLLVGEGPESDEQPPTVEIAPKKGKE